MVHEFDTGTAVHVHRDSQGVVRDLLHADTPYMSSARTPQVAAREYLEKFGPMLGITHEQLEHLGPLGGAGTGRCAGGISFSGREGAVRHDDGGVQPDLPGPADPRGWARNPHAPRATTDYQRAIHATPACTSDAAERPSGRPAAQTRLQAAGAALGAFRRSSWI